MPKIVFVGHSVPLGVGYGGVTVADTFVQKVGLANGYAATDIVNASVGGNKTADVLASLQTDVLALSPAVCVVMIGVNDWINGVPLATFKANLTSIVDQIQAKGIKCTLFTDNMYCGSSAQFASYGAFIDAVREVAFLKKCNLVDLYARMCQEALVGAHSPYYVDLIHLTVAGHAFVAAFAAKPWHVGFFNQAALPVVSPNPELALLTSLAEYVLASGHPALTASVKSQLATLLVASV
jgi:lysophospholipase L1-like esterase